MLFESIKAAVTIILSVTVMMLIAFATPKVLRDYARVIFATCIVELLFAASAYFAET
ncbi:hypothetical protein AAVH_39807, partial [Aphelenchoides avenae]